MRLSLKRLNIFDRLFCLFFLFVVFIEIFAVCRMNYHYPGRRHTENYYDTLARNLIEHGELAVGEFPDLKPDTYRPPLYAVILSLWTRLFGDSVEAGQALNIVFLSIATIMIYLTGRLFHPFVGLCSAVMYFQDPGLIQSLGTNGSDITFFCFFCFTVFFLVKFLKEPENLLYAFLFSIFFCLALFTRALLIMFIYAVPFVFLFNILYLKEPWKLYLKPLIIFLVIVLVPVSLWIYRNYSVSGISDFASMKSVHLFQFIAPQVLAERDGVSFGEAKTSLVKKYMDNDKYRAMSDAEKHNYRKKKATRIVFENFPYALKMLAGNIPRLLFAANSSSLDLLYSMDGRIRKDEISISNSGLGRVKKYFKEGFWFHPLYIMFLLIYFVLFFMFAVAGFFLLVFSGRSKWEKRAGIFFAALAAYLLLVSSLAVQLRFRMPLLPVTAPVAAYALLRLLEYLKGRKNLDRVAESKV